MWVLWGAGGGWDRDEIRRWRSHQCGFSGVQDDDGIVMAAELEPIAILSVVDCRRLSDCVSMTGSALSCGSAGIGRDQRQAWGKVTVLRHWVRGRDHVAGRCIQMYVCGPGYSLANIDISGGRACANGHTTAGWGYVVGASLSVEAEAAEGKCGDVDHPVIPCK